MIRIALAAALAVCVAAPAVAADIYRPQQHMPRYYESIPVSMWTGWHAGVGLGYHSSTFTDTPDYGIDPVTARGWLASFQLGYSQEIYKVVIGLETDVMLLGGKHKRSEGFLDAYSASTSTWESRTKWLGTTRAVLGYNAGVWMPYLTGGVAYGQVEEKYSNAWAYNDPYFGSFSGSYKNTIEMAKVGYVVGGGIKYKLSRNLNLGAEYLYADLGTMSMRDPYSTTSSTIGHHIGRIKLDYQF